MTSPLANDHWESLSTSSFSFSDEREGKSLCSMGFNWKVLLTNW